MSWTPEEKRQLSNLLQKAQKEGMPDELLPLASATAQGTSPRHSDDGFSLIAGLGSMSDASKRRDFDFPESKNSKRLYKQTVPSAAPSGSPIQYEGDIPGYEGGYYVAPGVRPSPFPAGCQIPSVEVPQTPLPEGVQSLSQWGRTLMSFGQYKDSGLSYFDVISSTEEKKVKYVRWCKSRSSSAGGFLKDFCEYIQLYEVSTGGVQGPCIPGTDHVRHFKS